MKNLIIVFAVATMLFSCDTKNKASNLDLKKVTSSEEKKTEKFKEIIKCVSAISGLNFRKSPKGKVLSKFKYNAIVTIVEKTGIREEIDDAGQKITGEWVGVKHDEKVVYVFDAFLAEPKKVPFKETIKNPIDIAIFEGYIIMPGSYHGEEIPNEINTQDWFGIFNKNEQYTVEKTAVHISSIHDAIVDDKGEKTGKKIVATNTKKCYLLMNNLSNLTTRNIDTVLTKSIVIHPEKPFYFQLNNIDYTLFSEAKNYSPLNTEEAIFMVNDYKLYLEKTFNGIKTKQLLLFEQSFDDTVVQILFIGDIDGDLIPDLLIDSSNHYNKTTPTLYLSKEAKKEDILKVVSLHTSVGC